MVLPKNINSGKIKKLTQQHQILATILTLHATPPAAASPKVDISGKTKVGVIGAGTMGSGIATCFLRAGYDVTLVDVNEKGLERGRKIVGRNIEQDVKRGRASQAKAEANIARLTPSTTLDSLAGVDMVVEAVFENLDLKKKIFKVRIGAPE